MVNNIPIGMENIPSNQRQDITSEAAMLLDSSTASVSALGATVEPRHDGGTQIVSCPESTEWYYLLLKSKDLKQFNEIFTGRRTVYAKPGADPRVQKYQFQFKTFTYTTVGHRKRLVECEYSQAEYDRRMAFVTQADEALNDITNDITIQDDPTGGGFLFVNAPLSLLSKALDHIDPRRYLVKDHATERPAQIPPSQMKEFICIYESMPWNFKFMTHPMAEYARKRQRVRITGGSLRGVEGYIIRIHRDRHFVFSFGNMALAINGIHTLPFEPASR